MPFIDRDAAGSVRSVHRVPQQECLPVDHPEVLAFLVGAARAATVQRGSPKWRDAWTPVCADLPAGIVNRGYAYITRDADGVITAAEAEPAAEFVNDDDPALVAYQTERARRPMRGQLEAQAQAALLAEFPQATLHRLALAPDDDVDKRRAAAKAAELQAKLAEKLAAVEAAATPEAVRAVSWS